MTDEFNPPIKSRSTDELLEIIGAPDKWNPKAVLLAQNELIIRKVPNIKFETAKYLGKKRERLAKKRLANESYHLCDFVFNLFPTLFEIIFSWELKKDGRHKKARQQKYFRIILGMFILILVIYSYLT